MASYIKTDNGTVKLGSGDFDIYDTQHQSWVMGYPDAKVTYGSNGYNDFILGDNHQANCQNSMTFGIANILNGDGSTVFGQQLIASGEHSFVFGRYNIEDTENEFIEIVGNGDSNERSNARTLDWEGNEDLYGNFVTIHNSTASTNTYFRSFREDTGTEVAFGIGTGGANHGIYSLNSGVGQGQWILYGNSSKDTTMQGKNCAVVAAGTAAVEIVAGARSSGSSDTSDATCTIIHPPTLTDKDSTGTVFMVTARPDKHWASGDTATTSTSCLLRCGADSTGRYLGSYATYARTTTDSANMRITSYGTFSRYTSSSARYKNSIQYLTNDDKAVTSNIKKMNTEQIPEDDYDSDMRSILNLPVAKYHFNDGYVMEPQEYDAENTWETGFIAEDVDEICPDMCTYIEDEDGNKIPEAWDYMKLLPRMVYVMQQQEARIKELEAKIGE